MLHWVISGLRCNQSSVVCERAAYANETIANTLARKYLRARYLLIARALAQIRDALIKSVIKIIMSDSLITKDLLIRKNWLRLAGHLDQVVALSATTTVSRRSRYADIECDYAFIFIHALAFREFASRLVPLHRDSYAECIFIQHFIQQFTPFKMIICAKWLVAYALIMPRVNAPASYEISNT